MAKKNSGKHPHTRHKTIQEIAEQEFPDPNRKKLFTMPTKLIGVKSKEEEVVQKDIPLLQDQSHYEELDKAGREYNENITNLDPDYSRLEPYNYIIVRCKYLEMQREGNVILPNTIPVGELTQNGMGIRKTLDSPWAFSTEAIIVASPPHFAKHYPPGTLIQIDKQCVIPTKAGVDHPFELPYAFTRPEWYDYTPPKSIAHKDYGYFRLPPEKIITKL